MPVICIKLLLGKFLDVVTISKNLFLLFAVGDKNILVWIVSCKGKTRRLSVTGPDEGQMEREAQKKRAMEAALTALGVFCT